MGVALPRAAADELLAAHSITRSARSRIDCGILSPSALAAFMLITNSNLLGCCIGKSPGFVPSRIFAT